MGNPIRMEVGEVMRARATRRGNRIHLWVDIPTAGLEERVPGAYWSERWGVWTFPLTMSHCRAIREEFGDELSIAGPLRSWARERVTQEDQMKALGATLAGVQLERVPEVYPDLAAALASRSYQATGARFIVEGRNVLIADTPGLGKTIEAIAGIVEAGVPGPYLVVAPKTSLDTVWEREILARIPDAYVMLVRASTSARRRALDAALNPEWDLSNTWALVNIEMIRTRSFWACKKCGRDWPVSDHPRANIIDCECENAAKKAITWHDHEYPQLFGREWGAIIMDESQKSLIRRSGFPTLTRNGARLLETRTDGLRIALSGTPMRGKAPRLFGTLNWLRPKEFTSFWSFVSLYWDVSAGYGGSKTVGELRPDRESWLMKDLDRVMLRRTKLEVSPELPPKAYMGARLDPKDPGSPIGVWLEMEPKQAKSYEEMLKMGSAMVDGGEMNALGGLAELTRLKQFATSWMRVEYLIDGTPRYRATLPSNKYLWLRQFLTELNIVDPDDVEPTGKVVIVSQFTDTLDLFRSALELDLGVSTLSITGRVTGRERTRAQDLFNDMGSGYNVLLLNTIAGGVSITLDAADDMVFIDETHDPDDQEQAEDRINNRRPEEKVATRRYWYLKSLGTVEEAIARVNLSNDRQQKKVLDGRRGVAYVREVFKEMER
jgi:SNF2 family DNA or RNA helicase